MIDCSAILGEFSDYRDGLMEPSRAASVEAHLRACPSCARYARVVEEGVGEYRHSSAIEPSADFLPRLQERIQLVDLESHMYGRAGSSVTSAGVVVLLVVLMTIAAWIPVLRSRESILRLPPVAAAAPASGPMYSFFRGPTLVVPTALGYSEGGAVLYRHASLNLSTPRVSRAAAAGR